jgi:hypothetical protein
MARCLLQLSADHPNEPRSHGQEKMMATQGQKATARQNIKKAQKASAARRKSGKPPKRGTHPLSSHSAREIPSAKFAFPKERKEPLTDARHVRNAMARFNQVEGVSKAEREAAWRRIEAAAQKYGIDVSHRPKSSR